MIILDTNQLRQAAPPHGAVLGMLQKLAGISGHELALPQMVLDEFNARYEHVVQTAIDDLQRAARRVSAHFSRDIARQVRGLDVAQALPVMQASVGKVFTILPTPAGTEHEALMREAYRRRPAKTDWGEGPGSGARDVVIWLTVLDTASRQQADVLFLSQDKGFGTDAGFHTELQEEAAMRLGGTVRLRLLNGGIEQLLGEVATKAPIQSNLMALLGHEIVTNGVASFLLENVQQFFYSLPDARRPFRGGRSLPDRTAPTMIPAEKPTQASAYKVDGTTCCVLQAGPGLRVEVPSG